MPLIKCENLCLGYDGRTVAKDLSFEIERGDYVCILGDNGTGKSTLVKVLTGLAKPLSGTIITDFPRTCAGYLPQQTDFQKDFPATVGEIVLSGCLGRKRFFSFYNSEDKKTARENMEKLGISELSGRSYKDLSGGQKQRVLIARALCAAKEIIILDEPASGLDGTSSEEMYEIINSLNKDEKMTVIMVSHDREKSEKYADKVLHLGKTQFFGTWEEYEIFMKEEKQRS
ncbi:MAG: metal ABC transporter ATP-binding protein [Clostridia bacterium]|nr:metal ABC transporter ATP-binding protein [Clostridia bacterium]